MIPESYNAIAELFQIFGSRCIPILNESMLSSVGLNDESSLQTNEIDDIRLNDILAPKLETGHAVGSQVVPQQLLRIRRLPAQFSGEVFHPESLPSPWPSPRGGGEGSVCLWC